MDALFSLPALSFLIIPTFSSYSTSLNLLFFYLTWSTLVLSHPPLKVEIVGTLAVRCLFYILPSTLFLFFDSVVPSAAAGLKAQGDVALPSNGEKGRWWRVALISVGNVLLEIALQAGVEALFTEVLHIRSALKVTTTLPMPWGIAKDLVRGLLLREVLQYYLHRYGLHSPNSPLSDLHQSWYHSLRAPYSLAAHYDHPLAVLLTRSLPTYLPAVFFRFHLLTYHLYIALISIEETFAYSGYSVLPSSFILGGIARRTDAHLLSKGKGNFSPYGLMDWICGTAVGDDLPDDVESEVEEHALPEKAGNMLNRARTRGRGARGARRARE